MKKLFSLLLALTMAVSLAACGAGTASDPQESQPSAPSVSEPPASAETGVDARFRPGAR